MSCRVRHAAAGVPGDENTVRHQQRVLGHAPEAEESSAATAAVAATAEQLTRRLALLVVGFAMEKLKYPAVKTRADINNVCSYLRQQLRRAAGDKTSKTPK